MHMKLANDHVDSTCLASTVRVFACRAFFSDLSCYFLNCAQVVYVSMPKVKDASTVSSIQSQQGSVPLQSDDKTTQPSSTESHRQNASHEAHEGHLVHGDVHMHDANNKTHMTTPKEKQESAVTNAHGAQQQQSSAERRNKGFCFVEFGSVGCVGEAVNGAKGGKLTLAGSVLSVMSKSAWMQSKKSFRCVCFNESRNLSGVCASVIACTHVCSFMMTCARACVFLSVHVCAHVWMCGCALFMSSCVRSCLCALFVWICVHACVRLCVRALLVSTFVHASSGVCACVCIHVRVQCTTIESWPMC